MSANQKHVHLKFHLQHCLIKAFVRTFVGGKLVRVVNIVYTSFRGIRIPPARRPPQSPTAPAFVSLPFQCHLPWPGGGGVPGMVMSNPNLIPPRIVLSNDTTAAATHYSAQPFGLLKDVMLSGLAFKAWSMYRLSRPLRNNAQVNYTDILHRDPLFFTVNRALKSHMCDMMMTIKLIWFLNLIKRFIFHN